MNHTIVENQVVSFVERADLQSNSTDKQQHMSINTSKYSFKRQQNRNVTLGPQEVHVLQFRNGGGGGCP